MKIAFVWDWEPTYEQALTWMDGLAAAIKTLLEHHDVRVFTIGTDDTIRHPYFPITVTSHIVEDVRQMNPDVILHWADMTRPSAAPLAKLGIPMALCFAGGEPLGANVNLFKHVFVESQVYFTVFADAGTSVTTAFGTNTGLFKPIDQVKTFDAIFPATFALWKRHSLFANAVNGYRALACGYMYESHEQECWQICLEKGVTILPHVPATVLKYLYAASKTCVIPSMSSGGSQRTILEAMAMNVPLVVCDSDKFDYVEGQDVYKAEPSAEAVRSGIGEMLGKTVDTRTYVVENWSEHTYARQLIKGLEGIC